jgi:cytochrome c biogenesis protein CcmG/thiol:disulfide interchange protein DsbE
MRHRQRTLAIASGVALVVVIVAVGILLAIGGNGGDEQGSSTSPGGAAPVADTRAEGKPLRLMGRDPITGERVRLADFEGKPIVLNFWASWCPPCRDELPALIEFAELHPDVAVVGVNLEDVREGARQLHREIGWDWPSIEDRDGAIAAKLGLLGMPTTFFLDERHVVVGTIQGETDLQGFERGLSLAQGT